MECETTTWREAIIEAMKVRGENWTDVEACTLTDAQLDVEFDDGYGCVNGKSFTLWTKRRVYFPVVYDGAEWCASVPRHPDGMEATRHAGGGA